MTQLVGWAALAAGAVFALWLVRGDRKLRTMVTAAYVLRAAAAIVHLYVIGLGSDSAKFDTLARELASGGIGSVLLGADWGSQYLYAMLVVGGVYSTVGPTPLAVQAINVTLGTLVVIVTYRITLELSTRAAALLAGWVIALLPSAIYFSGALLREAFVVFPMMVGLLFLVRWVRGGSSWQLVSGLGLIIVSAIFHPAGYFALVAAPLALLAYTFITRRSVSRRALAAGLKLAVIVGLAIGAVAALHSAAGYYRFHWLYSGRSITTEAARMVQRPSERIEGREDVFYTASGRFGTADTALLLAVRPAEFLFRPFVWEGYRLMDIARGGEALLTLLVFALIAAMLPSILRRQDLFLLMAIGLMLVAVYSVGSEELQQAFRHRSKLLPIFIPIAAPGILAVLSARRGAKPGERQPAVESVG